MGEVVNFVQGLLALLGSILILVSFIVAIRYYAKHRTSELVKKDVEEWKSIAEARLNRIEDLQRMHQSQLEQLHHENSELKDLNVQLQKENSTLRNLNLEFQLQVNALRSRIQQLEAGR